MNVLFSPQGGISKELSRLIKAAKGEISVAVYRFLRINKFSLAPRKEGQTKIEVLNGLLLSSFVL